MMLNMTRRWLEMLIRDVGAIDVRVDYGNHQRGGWCDSVDAALAIAESAGDRPVYTSINKADPEKYTVTNALGFNGDRMANKMVTEIRRMFFDFDPVRPTGVSSTAAELEKARQQAGTMARYLRSQGFPDPACGISGNGAHLLYRVAIRATRDGVQSYGLLFDHLARMFTTDDVIVDRAVKNPGRITRFYGTMNCKGKPTSERPSRRSSIWMPADYQVVPIEVISALLPSIEPPRHTARKAAGERVSGRGDYRTLDIVAWFQSHGLYHHHLKDNCHAVRCPWESEHTYIGKPGDAVVFEGSGGWPEFACKHGHCLDRRIRAVMCALGDADSFCGADFGRASR